jgi:hypothetical protein
MYEVLETLVAIRISASDVRRIPVNLGAGIDKKRQWRIGCITVEIRVMQHGAVLVQCDDITVR